VTEPVTETVAAVTRPVSETVAEVAKPVTEIVTTVTEPVTETVAAVTRPVNETVAEVAKPVTEIVSPVTEPVTQTVAQVVTTVTEPVAQTVAVVAQSVTTVRDSRGGATAVPAASLVEGNGSSGQVFPPETGGFIEAASPTWTPVAGPETSGTAAPVRPASTGVVPVLMPSSEIAASSTSAAPIAAPSTLPVGSGMAATIWALASSTFSQTGTGDTDFFAVLALAVVLAALMAGNVPARSSTGRSAIPRLLGAPG
jgi:hypothetical protein